MSDLKYLSLSELIDTEASVLKYLKTLGHQEDAARKKVNQLGSTISGQKERLKWVRKYKEDRERENMQIIKDESEMARMVSDALPTANYTIFLPSNTDVLNFFKIECLCIKRVEYSYKKFSDGVICGFFIRAENMYNIVQILLRIGGGLVRFTEEEKKDGE